MRDGAHVLIKHPEQNLYEIITCMKNERNEVLVILDMEIVLKL